MNGPDTSSNLADPGASESTSGRIRLRFPQPGAGRLVHRPGRDRQSRGPYGDVSEATFGQPGLIDYRNPNLAEAMRVSGLVQRYGVGIPIARRELHANNQPAPDFDVDAHRVRCTVYVRPDWPGNVAAP